MDSSALDIKYAILSKQTGLRIGGEYGEDRLNGVEINKISIDGETMHSFIRLNLPNGLIYTTRSPKFIVK